MAKENEEDMDVQENIEENDPSTSMATAPIVFRLEDYGPVDIPEAVQSVATYEPDGPRLMISQIVNENFKSYAGIRTLGPFHRNFTAIIGPNGSGKSNVIDSMLFVFGYRANKIRSKKISVLIHNSEKHQNINSCSVAVHFQKIIDTGPGEDEYTVVPNSQFVVSRVAFKDNSSSYYLDGKKSPYKEVAHALRGCGIDLDHNRFLILQGEVEQIAMMKPKALTEHEDGMLEFLEDIIGSNRFKDPIELLCQRVETLSDLRAEKLKRVKAVEKEMENLEGPRQEALEFLKTENNLMVLKNKLFQKYLMECTQHETKAQAEKDRLSEQMKEFHAKCKEVENKKKEKLKEYEQLKKEHKKLLKGCEESKDKFSDMECQDAKCREELKLNNAKIKKLEKNLENETVKIEELKVVPEQAEKSCTELKKKLTSLEKSKAKEEENEKEIMDSLKDETQDLQAEKNTKEAKLLEKQGELNEKKSKLQVSESELELHTAREQAESKKMENLKKSLKETETALENREGDITKLNEFFPTVETTVTSDKAELKQVINSETQCEEKRRSLQMKVEEVKISMASSKSKNRVLDALMSEKRSGNLPGIYGRLGDLGAIDGQYDVAISTACRALDNIVVDTVETGKQCVQFLKRNNIGQATFILLEKMEVWRNETKKKITTPENVPRLFDLVRVDDETLKTCFYFALRNTLVAKDIDQASRVAYGRTRFRVVTLKGELIEMSGAMSGGGTSVSKGKMGSSVAVVDVDPKEVMNMENTLEKLNKELESLQINKMKLEDRIQQNQKDLVKLKHNMKKHTVEIEGLKERRKSLESQVKDQEHVLQSVIPDQDKLEGLKKQVQECRKAFEKVSLTTDKLEEEVRELHNKILDIGKAKLSTCLSRLKTINNNIDQIQGQITKTTVGVKTSQRNLKRAEEKVVSLKEEVQETKQLIETLTSRLKEIEGEAKNLLELYERAQVDVREKENKQTDMADDLEEWEKQEAELAKEGVEFKHEMEKWDGMLRENKQKRKHWEKELTGLKLTPISSEETEEALKLPTHTKEELQTLSKQDVQVEITVQEEHLAKMKPNMAAIAEYRKKEELYLQRVGDLDQITNFRNEQRNCHDGLRKQRLEEFMQGFQVITNKLKEMYQMITLGGDAELELVDSLDPFSEGIVFSVRPPKKSWKNISNLSGGEKTLSSLALVFALHHFKPTPLYVMDEIDAALDFKNVSIVANYIKERTKNAQFIIISLRNNMFELADRLVGIYKTHDSTKSVTLNPWKLSKDFADTIKQVHNIDIESSTMA